MSFAASALSTETDSEAAFGAASSLVSRGLGGRPADLAMIFATPHHAEHLGGMAERLRRDAVADQVLGCTAESVIGRGREIEGGPALALWGLRMTGLRILPFAAGGVEQLGVLPIRGAAGPSPTRAMLLLGDPFSFPAEDWLAAVDERHAGLPVLGGMASGAGRPGRNRLVVAGEVFDEGAVGVLVEGPVAVRTVVSQGCRPIGRPMIVTRVDRNVVLELGRRPALEVLTELLESLPPDDLDRARGGLHLGRVMSEYQDTFTRGDFLVRNVVGVDPRGGVAIADAMRVGQTVQFHVRDAETADEDFRGLLDGLGPARPVAGLLFSCNGRGTRLFAGPDHDAGVLRDRFGDLPVAGFFAMGELGPVGGRNFLHGFTASVALFEESAD